MQTTPLEQVRESVLEIETALYKYDEIQRKAAESRWLLDMMRRDPKSTEVECGQMQRQHKTVLEHLKRAEEVVLYLTGAESVDAARRRQQAITSAFGQRETLAEALAGGEVLLAVLEGVADAEAEHAEVRSKCEQARARLEAAERLLEQRAEEIRTPEVVLKDPSSLIAL